MLTFKTFTHKFACSGNKWWSEFCFKCWLSYEMAHNKVLYVVEWLLKKEKHTHIQITIDDKYDEFIVTIIIVPLVDGNDYIVYWVYGFDLIVAAVCRYTLCLKSYVCMHDKQSNEERFEKTGNKMTRERDRSKRNGIQKRAEQQERAAESRKFSLFFFYRIRPSWMG